MPRHQFDMERRVDIQMRGEADERVIFSFDIASLKVVFDSGDNRMLLRFGDGMQVGILVPVGVGIRGAGPKL